MKNKVKRFLSGLLSTVLLVSLLAGCNQNAETQSQPTGDGTSAAASGEDAGSDMVGNMYKTGLPIVKEKMTFQVVIAKGPQDISANTGDKQIVKDFEEETNVHIEWTDVPNTAWSEKINIMFSSGEYPDMIITGGQKFDTVKFQPFLVPLDDLLAEYGPAFMEFYERKPSVKNMVVSPTDGKMYSIPRGVSSVTMDEDMWINHTWLDALGLEMPQDLNELYDVLVAFKTEDPNGNGQADEIPVLYCQDKTYGQLNNFFSRFGVPDNETHVIVRDGKTLLVQEQEGYYEGLKYLHKLYADGLLDPEGLTQTQQQAVAKAENGVAGVILDRYAPTFVGLDVAKEQYIQLPPIKGVNGEDPVIKGYEQDGDYSGEGFVITRACETPEVLVRWLNEAFSTWDRNVEWFMGPEGDFWEMVEDNGDYNRVWRKYADINQKAKDKGFKGEGEYRFTTWIPNMCFDMYDWYVKKDNSTDGMMPEVLESEAAYLPYVEEEYIPKGLWEEETAKEKNLLYVDLDNYIASFLSNSIINGIDDQQWQEHLEKLETLKVDRYLELYQEFYDRVGNQ